MSQQEEQHSPSRGVAVEVQDFYERYPYPRPIDSLEKYRRFGQDRQSRRVFDASQCGVRKEEA